MFTKETSIWPNQSQTIYKYRPKYLGCSLSPKLFSKMFVVLYSCQQCRRLWVVANSCYGQYLQSELCDRCVAANVYHLLLTIDAEHLFLWFLVIIYYLWWCVCSSLLPIFWVALLLRFRRFFSCCYCFFCLLMVCFWDRVQYVAITSLKLKIYPPLPPGSGIKA